MPPITPEMSVVLPTLARLYVYDYVSLFCCCSLSREWTCFLPSYRFLLLFLHLIPPNPSIYPMLHPLLQLELIDLSH